MAHDAQRRGAQNTACAGCGIAPLPFAFSEVCATPDGVIPPFMDRTFNSAMITCRALQTAELRGSPIGPAGEQRSAHSERGVAKVHRSMRRQWREPHHGNSGASMQGTVVDRAAQPRRRRSAGSSECRRRMHRCAVPLNSLLYVHPSCSPHSSPAPAADRSRSRILLGSLLTPPVLASSVLLLRSACPAQAHSDCRRASPVQPCDSIQEVHRRQREETQRHTPSPRQPQPPRMHTGIQPPPRSHRSIAMATRTHNHHSLLTPPRHSSRTRFPSDDPPL